MSPGLEKTSRSSWLKELAGKVLNSGGPVQLFFVVVSRLLLSSLSV